MRVKSTREGRRRCMLAAGGLGLACITPPAWAAETNQTLVHRLLAGTRWETACHVRTSGRPGPVVLVFGGVHGDEPAGAQAADVVRSWPIEQGSLLVVPRANEPALRARSRFAPRTAHADLARCFPRQPGQTPQGPLASALWRMIVRLRPDWLVDLHEGWGVHRRNPKTLGSSVLHGPGLQTRAQRMVDAVNATIPDARNHFTVLDEFVPGSISYAATHGLRIACFVQETTRVGRALDERVQNHCVMTRRLLEDVGMLDAPATS